MILIDTDILIFANRGKQTAINALVQADHKVISAVTYMEFVQGVRNKQEKQNFEAYLKNHHIQIIMVNEIICKTAMKLVLDYGLSHTMQLGDALIASTALHYNFILLSANRKHYQFIPNLTLQSIVI